MKLITKVTKQSELLKKSWLLSSEHLMSVFVLTMSQKNGLTILGTRKLERFMTIVGTEFEERAYDPTFYSDAGFVIMYNDFRYTDMQNEIEKLKDAAMILAKNAQILIIVANDEGRKFICISDTAKMHDFALELSSWITEASNASGSEEDK